MLAIRSLPNVTEADMAETLSLIKTNIDPAKLQALLFTQTVALRASDYDKLDAGLKLTNNIQQVVLPEAHREYQEKSESHDRLCSMGLHILTESGQDTFVRLYADLELAQEVATKGELQLKFSPFGKPQ
jgi:hypothetical protein